VGEQPKLDLVVLGATGFVGRLVARYLAMAAPAGVRIGLAGRSATRLAAVRASLPAAAAEWRLLSADIDQPATLTELAVATRVIASTAGPYGARGLAVIDACLGAGTHYADLAGEVLFIRDSIDRYHARAAADGIKIVHACGVDSIPSDLGVLMLYERARADNAGALTDTILLVTAFRGGVSGGTLASMRRQLQETRTNVARRRVVDDPYALSPDRSHEPDVRGRGDLHSIERRRELGVWLAPFVMAGINTRVVRRSNALEGWAYGRRFRYREATAFPEGASGWLKAAATLVGQQALPGVMASKIARPLLTRLLPAPGEGPDENTRRRGHFEMEIHTRTATGRHYVARVAARGDPGYTASSLMLGQSALCLALDHDRLPVHGGVLTPATAMGLTLVERLRTAGLTLDVST
jgi:short subunit dehydrogenase-like uncharacterized protein